MTAGIQLEQIGDGKTLPQNLLINPGFEIWQRGVGPFTSGSTFSSDEWWFTGFRLTVDKETTNQRYGSSCLKVDHATGGTDSVRQGIENYKSLEGQWLTFSAWVWCDTANAVSLRLVDYNGSKENALSDYHSGGSGWEHLTVVKKIRTGLLSTASFPHSFGLSADLYFVDVAVTDALMDGASLVIGNFPQGVPFIPLNPADDQARCERFFEETKTDFSGDTTSGSNYYGYTYWRQLKQASPTITAQINNQSRFPASTGTFFANTRLVSEYRASNSTGAAGRFVTDIFAEVT